MERLHINLYGVITLCLHQKDVKIRNISILFVKCLLIFVNIVHFFYVMKFHAINKFYTNM